MRVTIHRGAAAGDKVTVLRRALAQDRELSYRARGIAAYVLSRPRNWRTNAEQLAKEGKEGEHAVRTALRELEARGYLLRSVRRLPNGHLVTDWVLSDSPMSAVETGGTDRRKPPAGQPPAGQPTDGQPTDGEPPALLGRETEERDTTPPPPAGATASALTRELLGVVERAGVQKPPEAFRLQMSLVQLRGWTVDDMRAAAEAHDWSGARAGAVVTWARSLEGPPPARRGRARRPDWCGACDEATRLLSDAQGRPGRCPRCHPLAVSA